ncbi:uncharacterized protein LOC143051096 [Mytilus galloprovincialis]|uniref:uncharacterized protein LOC143051096 n=1 Tax=Mytilus galloprovincialis TaxID=29158 RepID=UPI003F7B5D0B
MELNDGLYSAIQKRDAKEVKNWLDRGAAINAILNDNKWSPLHIATYMNQIDVIELLLERKADVNLVDADGNTPLHLASCGSLPVTVILVEHGSRLDAKNIKGNTAIAEAEAESKKRQKKISRRGLYFKDQHLDTLTGVVEYLENVTDNPQNRHKVLTQKEENLQGNTAIAEAEAESKKRQKKISRRGLYFKDTLTGVVEYLENVTDNPQNRHKVLTQKEENLQATKNPPKIEKDIQLPWLVDAIEFQRMLSHGEYLSYENRLSLGGPCRAGKSTLASVLIGEKIPQKWNSTDGLVIFFGRNGIDIERNKMVPLKEDKRYQFLMKKEERRKNGPKQTFN